MSVFMKGFALQAEKDQPLFSNVAKEKTHKTKHPNFLYRIVKTNSLSCNQEYDYDQVVIQVRREKDEKVDLGITTHYRVNWSLSLSLWASLATHR